MKVTTFNHQHGAKNIPSDHVNAVLNATQSIPNPKKNGVRDHLLKTLKNKHGWSDEVKLALDSKITITAKKGDVGLCLQTGNMGRMYADLLKLECLFKAKVLKAAILIVPTRRLAKEHEYGANVAQFERVARELPIFDKVITIPMVVIGMDI